MLIQCAEQPVFLQCLGYCSPPVPILATLANICLQEKAHLQQDCCVGASL